jgi:hypothetical protein
MYVNMRICRVFSFYLAIIQNRHIINPLQPKLVSPYRKENTALHRYKDQPVNAI